MEEFNFIAIYPNIISFLLIDNFLTVHAYSTYVISLKLLKMFKDTEQKKKIVLLMCLLTYFSRIFTATNQVKISSYKFIF